MSPSSHASTPRSLTTAIALVLTLVAAVMLAGPAAADMHDAEVEVGGDANVFTPDSLEVEVGDTVLFTWVGGNHDVSFEDDSIGASETSSEDGTTFTATFEEEGTFTYTCTVHGGMDGEIVVVAAEADVDDAMEDEATEDDATEEDADDVTQPESVDSGTGGLAAGLPGAVLVLMAIGALALVTPVVARRR
ncbi:MAG: cupredoxin domain-containing protein [Nitriliruptoraceae bacterium]|nr:cupredoxin domain-containing protein [Nitriliruptoraceae bacterium]